MIVWVNGAFGSGKTTTAFELHRRIPGSFVYDPENAGFFIRKNVPHEMKRSDFQDYPMWRECNYSMLRHIDAEYDGAIIVPMTIVNADYFNEIVGRLREDGASVHHFALCASKEVLLKRLKTRGEGGQSWAAQQIDRCIDGLSQPVFRQHLDTDSMTVEDIVTRIASECRLPLLPDERGPFKKSWDRLATKVKHIRFFG